MIYYRNNSAKKTGFSLLKSPLVLCLLFLFFSGYAAPGEKTVPVKKIEQKKFPAVENFHKVSDELYRSGQPKPEDWKKLAEFGIKSVISLRDFGRNADKVGDSGIIAYSLPWRAENISEKDLLNVLILIKQAPKPVLIHCFHGSDRTGAAVAAYRVVFQKWKPDAAADELINGGFGHHKWIYRNIPRLIRNADYKKIRAGL